MITAPIAGGAQIGLEYRFGITSNLQAGVYRTAISKTIQFLGRYDGSLWRFESSAYDLGIFDQVIWLLSLLDLTGVMFAFFILLFSMSTFEDVKTSAVRASLNSAFASVVPPNTEATTFTSTTGRFLGNDEFQGAITSATPRGQ